MAISATRTQSDATKVGSPPTSWDDRVGILQLLRSFGVWVALLALALYGVFAVPGFTSQSNVTSLLSLTPPLVIAALGQTFVIAVGGLDLSVGMLMGLVGVLSVGLMSGRNDRFGPIVALCLCVGVAVGSFNGLMVAWTKMNPIILTFGMLFVLEGASYLYTEQSIGPTAPLLADLEGRTVGSIPLVTPLWIVLAILAWAVLAHTRVGQHIRAVGGNPKSALKAGIRIRSVRVVAYALSGLSGAIAGLLLASRLGAGYPLAGQGMELNAIVAVLVGGTPYGGGRGTIVGTAGGALLLSLFANLLNLQGVSPYVQQVAVGLFTVGAIALYSSWRGHRG